MPEHVHLLIGEPAKGNPSTVLQVLKQKVSRATEETGETGFRTIGAGISRGRRGSGGILAAQILRFQCLEREKGEGKTGVHACESRAKKIGESSEGVAVEQLVILREGRRGVAANRHSRREKTGHKFGSGAKENSKTAPLKSKGAAPRPALAA